MPELVQKSLDFIVSSPGESTWLVDVKGRRFPSGDEQKQYWKNWSTRDDLRSLGQWEALFGERFSALFAFAYNVIGDRAPLSADRLFEFRGALYGFVGIRLSDYAAAAHPISPSWDTVAMPVNQFRRLARPVDEFLVDNTPADAAMAPADMGRLPMIGPLPGAGVCKRSSPAEGWES